MPRGIYERTERSPRFQDLTGQVFRQVKVESLNRIEPKATYWNCSCVCGATFVRSGSNIKKSLNCGNRTIHPLKGGQSKQLEYACWKSMIARCTDPTNSNYFLYGGRGITVCEQWLTDFWQFRKDVGPRPDKTYSLDRIEVNGNYEPGNVQWATPTQQNNNRREPSKRLNFKQYQERATLTAIYPAKGEFLGLVYCALGAAGEVGEVAGKIKKLYRDKKGEVSAESRKELGKEIGDCIWYLSQMCSELDLDFSHIALGNLEKLADRKVRGVIEGNGDNR